MRFDILTLFPELVDTVLSESIIGRARQSGAITVKTHNIRDYSKDKHHRVDDTPYGGGKGMLMMAPPIYDCYEAVCQTADDEVKRADGMPLQRRVIYLSPKGSILTQDTARRLSMYDELILICGHYEGIDQRIIDEIVDEEISVGDYILTGGEIPACILCDCVARLCDGVLADAECYEKESFSDGKLEYPQYTRPYEYHGRKVPDILISGHHENIDRWRENEAEKLTEQRRPELLKKDNE